MKYTSSAAYPEPGGPPRCPPRSSGLAFLCPGSDLPPCRAGGLEHVDPRRQVPHPLDGLLHVAARPRASSTAITSCALAMRASVNRGTGAPSVSRRTSAARVGRFRNSSSSASWVNEGKGVSSGSGQRRPGPSRDIPAARETAHTDG